MTAESLTALLSAIEIKTELETTFESLVVWSVEITTLSDTALESATEIRSDWDVSLLLANVVSVEISSD
jgi:hypothetical protein